MQSSEARTFARFGGLLLLISLALPWFAIEVVGFKSFGFRLWRFDTESAILVVIYALVVLSLSNASVGSRNASATICLAIGGIATAFLIYKLWISPPGNTSLSDLAKEMGGGEAPPADTGTLKVNGQAVSDLTVNGFLEALGLKLKATYGAYVATFGSVLFTVGSYLEFRAAGIAPQAGYQAQTSPAAYGQQAVPAAQRYQAPTPQAFAPDPFAPPMQQAQPVAPATHVPPDPFAPPAQPPVQPVAPPAAPNPYSPPGPPAV